MSTTRGGNALQFYPSFWANDSVGNGYKKKRGRHRKRNTWTTMTRNIDCGPCVWDLGERSVASAVCGFLGLAPGTWFKPRLIITISRSAGELLRAVDRYHWDTRTVEFDLSRALFLS